VHYIAGLKYQITNKKGVRRTKSFCNIGQTSFQGGSAFKKSGGEIAERGTL
jgi:hypothetical protein